MVPQPPHRGSRHQLRQREHTGEHPQMKGNKAIARSVQAVDPFRIDRENGQRNAVADHDHEHAEEQRAQRPVLTQADPLRLSAITRHEKGRSSGDDSEGKPGVQGRKASMCNVLRLRRLPSCEQSCHTCVPAEPTVAKVGGGELCGGSVSFQRFVWRGGRP